MFTQDTESSLLPELSDRRPARSCWRFCVLLFLLTRLWWFSCFRHRWCDRTEDGSCRLCLQNSTILLVRSAPLKRISAVCLVVALCSCRMAMLCRGALLQCGP